MRSEDSLDNNRDQRHSTCRLLMFRALLVFVASGSLAVWIGCAPAAPPSRAVDIATADGVVLKGTLFAAASRGPAVLLLHQCDDQRTVWDPLGTRLAAAGITALSIDYRGYGESGGTPHDQLANAELASLMSTVWPRDIDAAFDFLGRQPDVTMARVGAGGGSCGVNNAVQLARRHSNVRALALLAGPADRDGRLFLEGPAAPPVFAAAAADDRYADFVAIMSWLFGVSHSAESRLAQYPDGGHAAIIFRTHPDLADAITRWFAAVLEDTPGAVPATNGVPLAPAILEELHAIDRRGGAAALLARRPKKGAGASAGPRVPEYFVNQLGYEHMIMKDYPTAIDLMKLNAALYPASPNTMDSLGDVYLAAGDTSSALAAAKQTLVLLDHDTLDSAQRKADLRRAAEDKITRLSTR
jgi:dienelactone hydrolase